MASVSDAAELRLGQNSNGMLLSPWEFDRADFDEDWRYELVNGVGGATGPKSRQDV